MLLAIRLGLLGAVVNHVTCLAAVEALAIVNELLALGGGQLVQAHMASGDGGLRTRAVVV